MADPSLPVEPKPPGAPRWLRVSAIVVGIIVVVLIVVAIVSGGEHGPRQHLPGGNPGGHQPPAQNDS